MNTKPNLDKLEKRKANVKNLLRKCRNEVNLWRSHGLSVDYLPDVYSFETFQDVSGTVRFLPVLLLMCLCKSAFAVSINNFMKKTWKCFLVLNGIYCFIDKIHHIFSSPLPSFMCFIYRKKMLIPALPSCLMENTEMKCQDQMGYF